MKRATDLFAFEEFPSSSPFVTTTWRTRSEPEESFISVAVCHWEIVVARQPAATAAVASAATPEQVP